MKRILILVLLLVAPIFVFAQKLNDSKNLGAIADETKLDLIIDFSEASILGVDFEDWVTGEPDWEQSYSTIRVKFMQAFNSSADKGKKPHKVGNAPNSNYVVYVKVQKVKDDWSEVHALVSVKNRDGEVIFADSIKGEQGRFGSVANLMGDAMEDMGWKVGRLIFRNAR